MTGRRTSIEEWSFISILPAQLAAEVDAVLAGSLVTHVSHGVGNPVAAGVRAAEDSAAVALIGPIRSRDVAETVEATAPAGLPLIAPMATWAGVTRDDEPGCDDPADHRGTVFRLLARDTEVAARIAHDVRQAGLHAFVVAGDHEYGVQLRGQLALGALPSTRDIGQADLVVLCGLVDEPEILCTRSLPPLPVIAFDGVQGADLGSGRDLLMALPFGPPPDLSPADVFAGVGQARLAATLVLEASDTGARDRTSLRSALRALNMFDEQGDPVDPAVWLWRVGLGWTLSPDRVLRH
jgi:hypothetical protein